MSLESIKAIKDSRPPTTDYLTYLTIVESHLSPAILPTLNEILQDAELTQNIGWDLIQLLLPLPESGECLATIACIGNPKEVVLKVTEALTLLSLDENNGAEEENDNTDEASKVGEVLASTRISEEDSKSKTAEPSCHTSSSNQDKISIPLPFHLVDGYSLGIPSITSSHTCSRYICPRNFWGEAPSSTTAKVKLICYAHVNTNSVEFYCTRSRGSRRGSP
jgi:hypothetical protein